MITGPTFPSSVAASPCLPRSPFWGSDSPDGVLLPPKYFRTPADHRRWWCGVDQARKGVCSCTHARRTPHSLSENPYINYVPYLTLREARKDEKLTALMLYRYSEHHCTFPKRLRTSQTALRLDGADPSVHYIPLRIFQRKKIAFTWG